MLELDKEEVEILYKHLIERQEGCFFVGEIVEIIEKLEKFLKEDN